MMKDQVFARAALQAGELDAQRQELLQVLCEAACASLEARLRDGISSEDCGELFATAACMYAMAALEGFSESVEFKAGDLSVKKGARSEKSRELCCQADRLMAPFLKDSFVFSGV